MRRQAQYKDLSLLQRPAHHHFLDYAEGGSSSDSRLSNIIRDYADRRQSATDSRCPRLSVRRAGGWRIESARREPEAKSQRGSGPSRARERKGRRAKLSNRREGMQQYHPPPAPGKGHHLYTRGSHLPFYMQLIPSCAQSLTRTEGTGNGGLARHKAVVGQLKGSTEIGGLAHHVTPLE